MIELTSIETIEGKEIGKLSIREDLVIAVAEEVLSSNKKIVTRVDLSSHGFMQTYWVKESYDRVLRWLGQ